MKQILKITTIISSTEYIGENAVKKSYPVTTEKTLKVGQSVLINDGVVIGVVQTTTPDVYEV